MVHDSAPTNRRRLSSTFRWTDA